MLIAIDMDGTIDVLPTFFKLFVKVMQKGGNTVGILTNRVADQDDFGKKQLEEWEIQPDFYISKPVKYKDIPPGIFKATVCNKLGINLLIDDFQKEDLEMIKDFKEYNKATIPFTLWEA